MASKFRVAATRMLVEAISQSSTNVATSLASTRGHDSAELKNLNNISHVVRNYGNRTMFPNFPDLPLRRLNIPNPVRIQGTNLHKSTVPSQTSQAQKQRPERIIPSSFKPFTTEPLSPQKKPSKRINISSYAAAAEPNHTREIATESLPYNIVNSVKEAGSQSLFPNFPDLSMRFYYKRPAVKNFPDNRELVTFVPRQPIRRLGISTNCKPRPVSSSSDDEFEDEDNNDDDSINDDNSSESNDNNNDTSNKPTIEYIGKRPLFSDLPNVPHVIQFYKKPPKKNFRPTGDQPKTLDSSNEPLILPAKRQVFRGEPGLPNLPDLNALMQKSKCKIQAFMGKLQNPHIDVEEPTPYILIQSSCRAPRINSMELNEESFEKDQKKRRIRNRRLKGIGVWNLNLNSNSNTN